jgi:iron-sulfur cluster repair protein YtfE (RIC family)
MRVSRVRKRILSDHEYLRGLVGELDQQVFRVAAGSDEGVGMLRSLGLQLLRQFSEHLAVEDRFLAPALRRAGPAGRERAEQLDADHREQRELLDYLLDKARDQSRPAALLAADWRSFVELLLDDMAQEERTILESELLEDIAPAKSPSQGSLGSRSVSR